MSIEIIVRDVRVGDAEAVIGILNPIIATRIHTVFDKPISVDAERDYILRRPSRAVWKIAQRQSDERVVGFQVLEPFGPYTTAFDHVGTLATYVDLEQRRQGVAKLLFAATFDAARQKGFEKLFTLVRADNPSALASYQAHGFRIVGTAEKHAKIDGQYIDEVLIEKILDQPMPIYIEPANNGLQPTAGPLSSCGRG
jgi:L-amino acid N-acyltransferase YncA